MAKFAFALFIMAVLAQSAAFAEKKEKRQIIDKVSETLFGKSCNDDSDCDANQCCVSRHVLGKRCRSLLEKGDRCGTGFFQAALDRVLRRCPCQEGLSCKNVHQTLLYKVYKCD